MSPKAILILILAICAAITTPAQNPTQLAKADTLYNKGLDYHEIGDIENAIKCVAQCAEIERAELGNDDIDLGFSLSVLGIFKLENGDPTGIEDNKENCRIVKLHFGENHPEYIDCLKSLKKGYALLGDFDEAIAISNTIVELSKSIYGEESEAMATIFSELAQDYAANRDYENAIKAETQALEMWEITQGKETLYYIKSLTNIASYKSDLAKYEEAIQLGQEALNLIEEFWGKCTPNYIDLLNEVALYHYKLGEYSKSIILCEEALKLAEELDGKNTLRYASILNILSLSKAALGEYKEALKLCNDDLTIAKNILGESHPQYIQTLIRSLMNMASCYNKMNNFHEAIKLSNEAKETVEGNFGKEHSLYSLTLNNLSSLYSDLGNNEKAISLCKESLNIIERIDGKNNPYYANTLDNLAAYNYELGNYQEAINLSTQAKEIIEVILGKNHPLYDKNLNNLASYNSELGNYQEAISLATEALEKEETILGKNHPNYANTLNNLAYYYYQSGDYQEAIRLSLESKSIIENTVGKDHSDYANSLNNLAAYNEKLQNFEEAAKLYRESIEVIINNLGKNHPLYTFSLGNHALLYFELGNQSEAKSMIKEALDIREKILGKNHPTYLQLLKVYLLSSILANDKQVINNLDNIISEVNHLTEEYIRNQFSGLSSKERGAIWNQFKSWFEEDLNYFAYRFPTEGNVGCAYDGALLAKGILLQSDIELSRLLLESGEEEVMDAFKELKNTRLMLDRLYEKPIAERVMSTDSLERVATALERDLVLRSKTFGDYTRNMSIGWRDVQKQLKAKDLAVEFTSFPMGTDSVMYAAYVLTADMPAPRMIPLFEARELAAIDPDDYYETASLSRLIWGKMADCLAGRENVYFAPAGELYNIAIESMPAPDGDGLISERHKLFRLSSTHELALSKERKPMTHAALYGGLTYNAGATLLRQDAERYPNATERDFSPINLVDSLAMRAGASSLPNTKTEVENIRQFLDSAKIEPKLFMGMEGTEGSFKDLSGRKINLMHIATHGFYWSESDVKNGRKLAFLGADSDLTPRFTEDKAMTRSGLLFTGANFALRGNPVPEGANDGILTAKEIAALDLRGLDLIVMSACQTGLGQITGDGVFGLQRGFKKAGANTLMMSLWKVDDRATQLLMTEFYRHLLAGKTKSEALTEAQTHLRTYREGTATPYSAPHFWAAFILLDPLH